MSISITLISEAFDAGHELSQFVTSDNCGGISTFTGHVRSENDIIALSIEHHPIMTVKALEQLAAHSIVRYGLKSLRIIHRYDVVKLSEPIVFIAAASAHRKEAMEAVTYIMDRLKTDVPFWKKEIFADGSENWIEQKQRDVERSKAWASLK